MHSGSLKGSLPADGLGLSRQLGSRRQMGSSRRVGSGILTRGTGTRRENRAPGFRTGNAPPSTEPQQGPPPWEAGEIIREIIMKTESARQGWGGR